MPLSRKQFSQNMESFFNYRSRVGYTSSQTVRTDRIDLKLFERFLIENNIEKINGKTVIAFQDYLVNQRRNSPASVNRKIFTLRAYQNFLELIDVPGSEHFPFKKVLKIRACRPLRANFLKQNEITKFFNTINIHSILGLRDYAIYALMYLLGLRVGEVFRLNLDDIDWQENRITVSGKRNQKRTLTMNKEMKNILDKYLALRSVIYKSEKSNALFLSKKGNRLAIRTMEDSFQKLLAIANLNKRFHATCHTLRHSFATMLNDKGVKILTIQNLLGHATPKTVIQYYLHTTEDAMRDALERLPLVGFINDLISSGTIKLTFQNQYRKRAG